MLSPKIWNMDLKANAANSSMNLEFEKDATGWEGNCCCRIEQHGDSVHLFPEDLPWLRDRINEMMEAMRQDGFVWND